MEWFTALTTFITSLPIWESAVGHMFSEFWNWILGGISLIALGFWRRVKRLLAWIWRRLIGIIEIPKSCWRNLIQFPDYLQRYRRHRKVRNEALAKLQIHARKYKDTTHWKNWKNDDNPPQNFKRDRENYFAAKAVFESLSNGFVDFDSVHNYYEEGVDVHIVKMERLKNHCVSIASNAFDRFLKLEKARKEVLQNVQDTRTIQMVDEAMSDYREWILEDAAWKFKRILYSVEHSGPEWQGLRPDHPNNILSEKCGNM